ncbi:hypothetical protein IFR04_012122 [Cadophora malorum]|uniref:DUF4267 domain-containing protein n=1 Tax=Cadophora malorum TaxID=108018 RepID=A0A8H7T4T4_9HELO|nr:hypothetical protein IFR04_012122 [Cadophora malorum]
MSDRKPRPRPAVQTIKSNSPLFWFTAIIPLAIILIGINFILNPIGASTGFGIPTHDPAAFPFMWIKGIRDIFSGLVVLWALWNGDRQIVATLFAFATIIPVGDGFVVLGRLGFEMPILIHWGTAVYMGVVSRLLFRGA